nr:hypothetical protein [Scytonema sp. UIC 10036]
MIGIVASRLLKLLQAYLVLPMETTVNGGSEDRFQIFDVHEALDMCSEYFLKFGGHQRRGTFYGKAKFDAFKENSRGWFGKIKETKRTFHYMILKFR